VWNTLVVQPISWLLRTLYDLTSSYGLAIILFTLLMKFVFLPFSMKSKKSAIAVQRFTPKLKELEAKYKNDKEKYNQELQKLYQKEKVNPLSGCLWSLLPFPVMIALYDVVRRPLTNLMKLGAEQIDRILAIPSVSESLVQSSIDLATAASNNQIQIANAMHNNFEAVKSALPEIANNLMDIDFTFLGLNLSQTPVPRWLNIYWFLPIISGAIAWFGMWLNQKLTGAADTEQNQQSKIFMLMSPVMSVWIGFMLPSAMSLYWIGNNLFGIIQDTLVTIYYKKKFAEKDAEKARKEAEEKEAAAKRKAELAAKREASAQKNRSNMSQKKYKRLKSQMQPARPKDKGPARPDAAGEKQDEADESKGAND
jgi:YidC/Oxa1 family membrane protein insertase